MTVGPQPSAAAKPARRPALVRIIGRLNIGGPARQACLLHRALRVNYDTTLIAGHLDAQEGDMSYLLAPEEPGVVWLGAMSRPIRLWNDLFSMLAIWRVLRRVRPRIVHTHTAKAGAVGRVAAILAGVPVIIHTYHGHVFSGYFSAPVTRIFIWIERLLNRFTTRVIAISDSQARELSEVYKVVPREKIAVISNGFEFAIRAGSAESTSARTRLRRELGLADGDFAVLWAGRLVPVKDVSLLANVVRISASTLPNIKFMVAGDGVDRPLLLSRTEGCGNLQLLGWRKDIAELWHAADCALLTSKNEGTPASLIEAMAAGRPFVSVNVGGVADLAPGHAPDPALTGVERSSTGFLTPRTADVIQNADAIVACLKTLSQGSSLAASMGRAGNDFALENFSTDRLIKNVLTLYGKLMN